MPETLLLWDASALVKRYYAEVGRETVNALFASVAPHRMLVTPWGFAETYSILLRRYNDSILDLTIFSDAVSGLQAEVLGNPAFGILSVSDATIFNSLSLMQAHNINSADAAILSAYLRYRAALREGSPTCC